VSAIAGQSGDWQNAPFADAGQEAVSAAAAAQVLRSLPQHGGAIVEFAAQALAGPEGSSNAWYLGLAPTQEPRFAVVVVVEDSAGSHTAASVGRALLNRVLAEGD
jgi:hypothetical protein